MRNYWVLILYLISSLFIYNCDQSQSSTKIISKRDALLSRRKRYLVFPEGSELELTMENLVSFLYGEPFEHWYFIQEVELSYELPPDTRIFRHLKNYRHHRDRRNIFEKVDREFTKMGFNGTSCIQRILCEAQEYIPAKGSSIVKDILLAVFSSPIPGIMFRPEQECGSNTFLGCSISIMTHVLGDLNEAYS